MKNEHSQHSTNFKKVVQGLHGTYLFKRLYRTYLKPSIVRTSHLRTSEAARGILIERPSCLSGHVPTG